MWSLPASLDLRSSSILGVGHFIVPPDVIAERSAGEPSSSIRTIVVPHGIIAVPRRSPIKTRKRTPWRRDEAPGVVERAGNRDWFTDRLFVEAKQANLPAACSTSALVHAVVVLLVLLLLAAGAVRADLTPRAQRNVALRMPGMASLMPVMIAPPPAPKPVEPLALAHEPPPPAAPPARVIEAPVATSLETPSSVDAFPTTPDDAPSGGVAIGAEVAGATDGVTGGVAGGTGSGPAVEAASAAAIRPLRAGEGIDRPRKIKHVKPVYPQPAMASQIGGSVIIEATIGVDGKVQDTRVVRSIAALDQAAIDAVRQWEFEPSRVNGVPVSVIMVVIVAFALL
jgi:protein TonB